MDRRASAYRYCEDHLAGEAGMKRVAGFALFWIAVGMVIDMLLPNLFVQILCAVLFILIGYELYCCK